MKKLAFVILLLFSISALPIYSQTDRIISFDFVWGDKGDLSVFATNKDCCDYYLIFDLPSPEGLTFTMGGTRVQKVLSKSRTEIMTLKRTDSSARASTGRYTYFPYAGNPNKKPNLDYQYALPIAAGDSILVSPVQSNLYTQEFDVKGTNDTIYASRAGIVCDYVLRRNDYLTVYHKDGTFADYKPSYKFSEFLVAPGDKVEVGQPIAITDALAKKVQFSVYFLEKNKLKERMNPHSGLVPLFQTKEGENVKLEFNKSYAAELTTDMITQDMSKKESKKYIENLSKNKK